MLAASGLVVAAGILTCLGGPNSFAGELESLVTFKLQSHCVPEFTGSRNRSEWLSFIGTAGCSSKRQSFSRSSFCS